MFRDSQVTSSIIMVCTDLKNWLQIQIMEIKWANLRSHIEEDQSMEKRHKKLATFPAVFSEDWEWDTFSKNHYFERPFILCILPINFFKGCISNFLNNLAYSIFYSNYFARMNGPNNWGIESVKLNIALFLYWIVIFKHTIYFKKFVFIKI